MPDAICDAARLTNTAIETVDSGTHAVAAGGGDLAETINECVQPPVPVGATDVHIRTMLVASEEVNDHGGRFPVDELERLGELLVDSPVLVGHDRSTLPVARSFKAELTERDGTRWVRVWFYWPRDVEGSERLRALLDSGVVKEGSLGFEYEWPECSVCHGDFRNCEHRLNRADGSDAPGTVWFDYRNVRRVLETSLVYRGAVPGTRVELARKPPKREPRVTDNDDSKVAPGRTVKPERVEPSTATRVPFAEFRVYGRGDR